MGGGGGGEVACNVYGGGGGLSYNCYGTGGMVVAVWVGLETNFGFFLGLVSDSRANFALKLKINFGAY